MQPPSKAVPRSRSQMQSKALVLLVGSGILLTALLPVRFLGGGRWEVSLLLVSGIVSLTFGVLVWALRAATPGAAILGALICDCLTFWTSDLKTGLLHTALLPLTLLFVLTFVATRLAGRRRPEFTAAAETRRGRTAAQVVANLGLAPLLILAGFHGGLDWALWHNGDVAGFSAYVTPALVLAALAEATADTLSSEVGQAFGGTPWLLTTLRPAMAGTDGAVSLLGTVAGLVGATLVAAAGGWAMHLDGPRFWTALAGGVAGLFFDSLLGATAERRGWLNNDLVNFSSTMFAAVVTLLLLAV